MQKTCLQFKKAESMDYKLNQSSTPVLNKLCIANHHNYRGILTMVWPGRILLFVERVNEINRAQKFHIYVHVSKVCNIVGKYF